MKEDIYFVDETVSGSFEKSIVKEYTFPYGDLRYYVYLFDNSKLMDSRKFFVSFHKFGIFYLYIASDIYSDGLVNEFILEVDSIKDKYIHSQKDLRHFLDKMDDEYDLVGYMSHVEAVDILVREYVKEKNLCEVSDINSNLEAILLNYIFLLLIDGSYIEVEDYYVDRQINCEEYMMQLLSKELCIGRKLRHKLVRSKFEPFKNVFILDYRGIQYQISIYGDKVNNKPVTFNFKSDVYSQYSRGIFFNWPDIYIESYYSKKNLDLIIEKIKSIDTLYAYYRQKWNRQELRDLINMLFDFVEHNEFVDEIMYPWDAANTLAEKYFKYISVEVENPELHILAMSIVISRELDVMNEEDY